PEKVKHGLVVVHFGRTRFVAISRGAPATAGDSPLHSEGCVKRGYVLRDDRCVDCSKRSRPSRGPSWMRAARGLAGTNPLAATIRCLFGAGKQLSSFHVDCGVQQLAVWRTAAGGFSFAQGMSHMVASFGGSVHAASSVAVLRPLHVVTPGRVT